MFKRISLLGFYVSIFQVSLAVDRASIRLGLWGACIFMQLDDVGLEIGLNLKENYSGKGSPGG